MKSKRAAIVQAVVIFFSVPRLECPGNWTGINTGGGGGGGEEGKNAAIIRVITLKLELRPLARYCTHQETTSERSEQVLLPFDQDWNDLGGGGGGGGGHYLSWTRINTTGSKCGSYSN